MKEQLLKQKRVSILIPQSGGDANIPASVNLNGYRLDFPTNTYIDVPEQIAEIIRNSNDQTIAALNQYRIGGDSKKGDALN